MEQQVESNQDLPASADDFSTAYQSDIFIPPIYIPVEMALYILSFLELKSLHSAVLVNKQWNEFAIPLLWPLQLRQVSQSYLWRHLFKDPAIGSYQEYFTEIFAEPTITIDNFFEIIDLARKKIIDEAEVMQRQRKTELLDNFFKQLDIIVVNKSTRELIEAVLQIPEEIRNQVLNPDSLFKLDEKNYKQLLSLLYRIYKVEMALASVNCLAKFAFIHHDYLGDFVSSPVSSRLSPRCISFILSIHPETISRNFPDYCTQLLNKLNANELVSVAECSNVLAEHILKYANLDLLDDNQLLTLFFAISPEMIEVKFSRLLHGNQALLNRFNAQFLLKLISNLRLGFGALRTLIFWEPKLINRLTREQCAEILAKVSEYFIDGEINYLFQNATFKSYVLSQCNSRHFLLSLTDFTPIYIHDWAVKLLTPEDTLSRSQRKLEVAKDYVKQNSVLSGLSQLSLTFTSHNQYFSLKWSNIFSSSKRNKSDTVKSDGEEECNHSHCPLNCGC